MKRNAIVLSLMLLVAGVINSQAQGFHLGIKAGANLDKINGQSFDQGFQFGYNVGAFAEVNFTPMWGIQPEVLFNQTNYRTGDRFSDIYPGGVDDVKGKLNYLSIPLLLSFRPIPLLSLQAGPQFGIKLNSDEHLINNARDAFKTGDFSLVGGAQLNIAGIKIGARYIWGLADVNNVSTENSNTTTVTWKNQSWQVYAGFRIF
jgi:Outer membrane protein beta-barrel domain